MLARQSLSGAETSSFWNYWNGVKNKISQIYSVGGKLAALQIKAANLKERAYAVDTKLADEAGKQASAIFSLQERWEAVRKMIDQYLPTWKEAETAGTADHPLSTDYTVKGLGAIPLILVGGAALAALAYVATSGATLIKDYEFQKAVLGSLERRLITTEQAKWLIKAGTAAPTFGTEMGASIGKYVGLAAAALGAVYLLPMLLKKRSTR